MAAFPTVFRQRILDAALHGDATEQAVADRFGLSRSFVQKLKRQWRRDATIEPVGHRGGATSKLSAEDRAAVAAWLNETPDLIADEVATRLAGEVATRFAGERCVIVSGRTAARALVALGLTRKKRRSGQPRRSRA